MLVSLKPLTAAPSQPIKPASAVPQPHPAALIPNSPSFNNPNGQATHKHELLNLKMVTFWRPVLIQSGNVPTIFAKIRQFLSVRSTFLVIVPWLS